MYRKSLNRNTFSIILAFVLIVAFTVPGLTDEVPDGGWLDEIVAIEEDSTSAAITQMELGELGLYAEGTTEPEIYQRILDSDQLQYAESVGSYNEFTFNPVGPVFEETGELNPFAIPRVREAMNWLIDRDYIAEEIYGGMSVPRYFPLTTAFPDYANLIEKARELEVKYAHDPERAENVITEEMKELGAEMVDGSWHFEGEPVEISILIRIEDEREELGDYLAALLEDIGFEVERRYATAAEASPIWISGNPAAGEFHIYTGGWITTVVARDQSDNLDFFYTPRGLGSPLWQAYDPDDEFDELADRLSSRDFETMEERNEIFSRALELAMEDSVRIWLVDNQSVNPYRSDVEVAADLAGGISGSYLWAYTLRYADQVGGSMQIGLPSVMPEPWNPLDGSNWIYDMMLIRATGELGYMWDPYTGLHHPNRVERAELYIREGLPVETTLDWVDLNFVEENQVPEDAWADWDPEAQEFITVGEKYPDGVTANRRVRTYYPEDFYDNVSWHDGSNFSIADIIYGFIMSFDRGMEESPFFDEAKQADYESFMRDFHGFKIVSEDPLIIEYYADDYYLDAEWYIFTGFPYFAQGPGAWHNLALGYKAEVNEDLAFSSGKADRLEVEWLSYIGGPSLEILEGYLDEALAENFIPYEATLGEFISEEEAQNRWENLQTWYEERDHFWLGTGPYYVDSVYPVEGMVQLARYEDHPDPADRWEIFAEPMMPEVDARAPGVVRVGQETTFDISITFAGEPYPSEEIEEVSFLLFDADGNLVHSGEVVMEAEGEWKAELTSEITGKLKTGSSRFEVIVSPRPVASPEIEVIEFVSIE